MTVYRPAAFFLLSLVLLCLAYAPPAETAPPAALELPAAPAPPAPPGWAISCVYCPKRFDAPGQHYLQVDAAGRTHVAYGGDALYYAVETGDGWQVETVDPAPGARAQAALALNSAGQPLIVYRDQGTGDLKAARKAAAGWEIETVDAEGDAGLAVSLALDAAGRPHVAYRSGLPDEYGNMLMSVRYASRDDAGWHPSQVAASASYSSVSLALAPDAVPHVAYSDENDGVRYTYLGPDGWQPTPPVVEWCYGAGLALALDAAANPNLLYTCPSQDWPPSDARGLYFAQWAGSGWAAELIDKDRGMVTVSLRLDAAGQPHFVGYSTGVDRSQQGRPSLDGFVWYGWRDGDGWHYDAIQASATDADLAWAPGGGLRIAYFLPGRSLEWAMQGPLGGWQTATVDRQEPLSDRALLAVDRQGGPQVIVRGHSIYHGRLTPDGWQLESVLQPAEEPRSFAVDSLGRPHLALLESYVPRWEDPPHDTKLWYARGDGADWQQTEIQHSGAGMPVLAADAGGGMQLAYLHYFYDLGNQHEIRYTADATSDAYATLGSATHGLSMALDASGYPHISSISEYWVQYRFFDGSTWITEPVGPEPEGERVATALALDPAGRPAIAYIERVSPEPSRLWFATRAGGWQAAPVAEAAGWAGLGEQIAFTYDARGVPHLLYWRAGRLEHAWTAGGSWHMEVVDPGGRGGGQLGFVSTPDGRLIASYIDTLGNDARLAELQPAPGALFLPLILR